MLEVTTYFVSEFYYGAPGYFSTLDGGKIHVIILRNYTITTLFRPNDRIPLVEDH